MEKYFQNHLKKFPSWDKSFVSIPYQNENLWIRKDEATDKEKMLLSIVTSEVMVSEPLGAESMLYTKIGDQEFVPRVSARDFHRTKEMVTLAFDMSKVHFFDTEAGNVLLS